MTFTHKYETYNYNDKMLEIIKYIISYHIREEFKDHKILSKLSFTDINKCYVFCIKYEDEYYNRNSDPSIYFIDNTSYCLKISLKSIFVRYNSISQLLDDVIYSVGLNSQPFLT